MFVPISLTTDPDGEPRRRFFLLTEVSFAASGKTGGGYYPDDELVDKFGEWVDGALNDRDDTPEVKYHAVPAPLDTDVAAVFAGTYPGNADALGYLRGLAEHIERVHRVDAEAAHSREDTLMRTALEAIRDGAGDPAALAAVALSTLRLTFERNCA